MTAMSKEEQAAMPVEFKLNGRDAVAHGGETIIQTAKRLGVEIPHLCYKEGLRPDGNCRACVVEVKGERVLAASCCRKPTKGMEVTTDSARAVHSQKMVLELLLSDIPDGAPYTRLGARLLGGDPQGRQAAFRAPPSTGRRSFAPRHSSQPRLLHPVHPVSARLPRGAGE
jgi:formate dehydrogenase major subunit